MYSAESGMAAGGQVQLISKMGTNQFTGTAYNFIRNDAFDSRPFGTVGELPPFSLNQFGVNLGGPIVTGRTFFFVNYEGLRQRQTQSFTRFVPSAAYRAGVTGALASVVALYPSGTGSTSDAAIDEWRGVNNVTADENAGLVRIDQRVTDKTSFFARYNFDKADIISPADTGFTTNKLRPSNFAFQLQRIFGPSVVNELKFGYNASLRNSVREGPSTSQISVPDSPLSRAGRDHRKRTLVHLIDDIAILRDAITSRWAVKFAVSSWASAKAHHVGHLCEPAELPEQSAGELQHRRLPARRGTALVVHGLHPG